MKTVAAKRGMRNGKTCQELSGKGSHKKPAESIGRTSLQIWTGHFQLPLTNNELYAVLIDPVLSSGHKLPHILYPPSYFQWNVGIFFLMWNSYHRTTIWNGLELQSGNQRSKLGHNLWIGAGYVEACLSYNPNYPNLLQIQTLFQANGQLINNHC